MLKGIFKKIASVFAFLMLWLMSLALTVSSWAVTFEAADSASLDSWVGNAIWNLWAGFSFVLPYLGVFLGIALVLGIVMQRLTRWN